jgi:putative membrane protein
MHAGRNYTLKEISTWTRRETAAFLLIAAIPTLLFQLAGWTWLTLPWQPLAIVGTAVAFVTGFKNNASYARLWEARQIWGSIVNSSRAWSLLVHDLLPPTDGSGADIRTSLIYRHLAWVTALRFQLREPRVWENMNASHNREYQRKYQVVEWETKLEDALRPLLPPTELSTALACKNRATHLLSLQGRDIARLRAAGLVSEFDRLELERTLVSLLDAQGRCERIKNYPYPRQFATLNLLFVWTLIVLMPLALLAEFSNIGPNFPWATIPTSIVVSWVFHTMDKIGTVSENPFQGGPNDVPITALSRTIEIDLREALGESNIPAALQPVNHILM